MRLGPRSRANDSLGAPPERGQPSPVLTNKCACVEGGEGGRVTPLVSRGGRVSAARPAPRLSVCSATTCRGLICAKQSDGDLYPRVPSTKSGRRNAKTPKEHPRFRPITGTRRARTELLHFTLHSTCGQDASDPTLSFRRIPSYCHNANPSKAVSLHKIQQSGDKVWIVGCPFPFGFQALDGVILFQHGPDGWGVEHGVQDGGQGDFLGWPAAHRRL